MGSKLNFLWLILINFVSKSLSFEQSLSKLETLGKPITIKDFMDDWNYFVRIECQKFCGGVLIHPKWVLTTADCIGNDQPQCIVRLGTIYIDDINGDESIKISSAKTIIHPFLELENQNDYKLHNIGLILLQNRVRLSRKVNLVTIPDDIPWDPENCYVVSWGGDIFPISLYSVALNSSNFKHCDQLLKLTPNRAVTVPNICDMFGLSHSEKDTGLTSMLHSGAPLMCNHFFYGILNSTGYSTENNYFIVWNYLLGYLEWINEQLKDNNDRPIQVLRIKSFDNITDPKLTLRTKRSTITTTEKEIVETKNYENKRFYIDPFEMYINQTLRSKKNFRRYNPRFRKLNTFLRKQESDSDLTYEEFDEVETNTNEILTEKNLRRKKSRKNKKDKRKNKKILNKRRKNYDSEEYDSEEDTQTLLDLESGELEETVTKVKIITKLVTETTEEPTTTEEAVDTEQTTQAEKIEKANQASKKFSISNFVNVFIWTLLTLFFTNFY